MPDLDFARFDALTFDCYGTLIDWETGILAALRTVLERHAVRATDEELLVAFARHEAAVEAGPVSPLPRRPRRGAPRDRRRTRVPTRRSTRSRRSVARSRTGRRSPIRPTRWRPLAGRYRLGVITNCDDDLFAASNRRLGVDFDWIVTAEQLGSYKPAVRNFELALDRIGLPRERILHVAQSLYHDHVPARSLGLATAWIDRRHGRPGSGATPPAEATPDLSAPDMAAFARLALA